MNRLRELLEQLTLHFQVEIAISDLLEDHAKQLRTLEQQKLKFDTKIGSLEARYSEMLMVLKDINKKLEKQNKS